MAYLCMGMALAALAGGAVLALGSSGTFAEPIHGMVLLHVPVAVNALLGAMVVFIAAIGYLLTNRRACDDLAHAAACVTVLNATVLLITGMFWAKAAWGQWWSWTPRLTFSLVLWALYAGLLVVRSRVSPPAHRAAVSAVYSIVAFLDVPLLYLSAELIPDIHPANVRLANDMGSALWMWFFGITFFSAAIIAARYELGRLTQSPDALAPRPLRHTFG